MGFRYNEHMCIIVIANFYTIFNRKRLMIL